MHLPSIVFALHHIKCADQCLSPISILLGDPSNLVASRWQSRSSQYPALMARATLPFWLALDIRLSAFLTHHAYNSAGSFYPIPKIQGQWPWRMRIAGAPHSRHWCRPALSAVQVTINWACGVELTSLGTEDEPVVCTGCNVGCCISEGCGIVVLIEDGIVLLLFICFVVYIEIS